MTSINYCCPNCLQPVELHQLEPYQFYRCGNCSQLYPVVNSLVFFNEGADNRDEALLKSELIQQKLGTPENYLAYGQQKLERNIVESYAAFQPFNESSRAIYPFVPWLKLQLKPGDVILDTWSRTGWTALLLASLFPEQQVIACWEGDLSVLGYAGYNYWFSPERRPNNLAVLFLGCEQNMPFADDCISMVHGHDVLHRRKVPHYLQQIERVCQQKSTILLPHVHLADSQPEPFFERGGDIRTGAFYQKMLADILASGRLSALLSEPLLFDLKQPFRMNQATNTNDYNGMLVISNPELARVPLNEHWVGDSMRQARFIENPLLRVCPFTRIAQVNQAGVANQAAHLLERHPVYQDRLSSRSGMILSPLQLKLLTCELGTLHMDELVSRATIEEAELLDNLSALQNAELIAALPLHRTAQQLQRFHSNNHQLIEPSFQQSWHHCLEHFSDRDCFPIEKQMLSVAELQQLVDGWRTFIRKRADIAGVRVSTSNGYSTAFVMACWLEGVHVNSNIKDKQVIELQLIDEKSLAIQYGEDYWELLQAFISDIPLAINDEAAPAKVGNQSWYQWLCQVHQLCDGH